MDPIITALTRGIAQLGLSAKESQLIKWHRYLELLVEWNQVYRLSGVRDIMSMVSTHILDSLTLVPYIISLNQHPNESNGQTVRVLDVGTGAGIPGIPLAIFFDSQVTWDLIDAKLKKIRFVRHAIYTLDLSNVTAYQQRVEAYQSTQKYNQILCRAYGPIDRILKQCNHLIVAGAELLLMKGQYPQQEIQDLPITFEVKAVHSLQIPGQPDARHLVVITRRNSEVEI